MYAEDFTETIEDEADASKLTLMSSDIRQIFLGTTVTHGADGKNNMHNRKV